MDGAAAADRTGQGRLARQRADHPPSAPSAGLGLEAPTLCAGTTGSGLPGQKGAVAEQVGIALAAGGEGWFGDETTLREYPPLRAAWAQRGAPAHLARS